MILAQALLGSVVTSVVPALLLLWITPSQPAPSTLRIMLSFASGSLLGDAVFHLLPHVFTPPHSHDGHHTHAHDHGQDHGGSPPFLVMVGLFVFFALDVLLRPTPKKPTTTKKKNDEDESKKGASSPSFSSSSAVALNLLSDAAHNLTDGIVIGAAFAAQGDIAGWRTVLAVLVHEVPHELGDFAVLKACGLSRKRIVASQLLTAVANAVGAVLVASAVHLGTAVQATLSPIVAGAFLYVGLSVLLGDVRQGVSDDTMLTRIQLLVAFASGVGLLHATTFVESYLGVHAH